LPEEELNKKYAALNHHLQLFKEFKETCKANKKGSGKTEENNLMQGYHWKVPRWFLVYILQLQHHQHQHSMHSSIYITDSGREKEDGGCSVRGETA
jgi:hypothetical protein